ncbi:MAG: DUF5317 family protein [Eubacteriales bacterium]
MLLFIVAALCVLLLKHYKVNMLPRLYALYPLFACEAVYIFFQINAIAGNLYFVRFASYLQTAFIAVLLLPVMLYKLYKPAVAGAALTVAGTLLNKLCIAANGGHMPVYPTLSRLTGYFRPETLGGTVDSLHILMTAQTKLNFLADYIDIGWSILSVGDILIHSFCAVIVYYSVKAAQRQG